MIGFLRRLKQRKLVQWALAYVAGGWALLQVLDLVGSEFGWPGAVMRVVTVILGIGFVVALVLAWYHGERGAQRVGGIELLMLAALLVIAAVAVSWVRHSRAHAATQVASVHAPAVTAATAASAAGAAAAPAHPKATSAATRIAAQPIPAKSVAVLPFENLSADKNNAYFADGMQDLILTKLADIGDLKVISRTSTLQYGSHPENLKLVGQQLGVATILEGSVQKAGKQVLINVQLIDAKTDGHIWAKSYQRTLDNIFGVEGEVAEKVAKALQAKLTPAETTRVAAMPTKNAAAYDAYLRGEYYRVRLLLPHNFRTAASYYRKAVAQDPQFALAWARLSLAQSWIARDPYDAINVKQALAAAGPAKAALDRALALAPDAPDVQLAKGWYLDYVKRDQAGALKAFETALATQPGNAKALDAVGVVYDHQGHWRKALVYFQKAVVLAPRDTLVLHDLCDAYGALRRYPDAVRIAKRWVALDPAALGAIVHLKNAYAMQGDLADAQAALDATPASLRGSRYVVMSLVDLKQLQRDFAGARKLLDSVKPNADMPSWSLELLHGVNELYASNKAQARRRALHAEALFKVYQAKHPQGAQSSHASLSAMYAILGLPGKALREARLAAREMAARGSYNPFDARVSLLNDKAGIQALLGNAGKAVKPLGQLLALPAGEFISVQSMKLDPVWDPIRHDPRFQALLKKYGHG